MFELINGKIKKRMEYLEDVDTRDRKDGTPRMKRLLLDANAVFALDWLGYYITFPFV